MSCNRIGGSRCDVHSKRACVMGAARMWGRGRGNTQPLTVRMERGVERGETLKRHDKKISQKIMGEVDPLRGAAEREGLLEVVGVVDADIGHRELC